MKVFKKIALSFALVLAICLPSVLLAACGNKEKLSLVQTFKTEYYVGQDLDITGGILKYVDEEGKSVNVGLQESMVSVFSTEKPGSKKMVITYEDETLLVDYIVKPWDVQENVYYSDSEQQLGEGAHVFVKFDPALNKVTTVTTLTNPFDPEEEKSETSSQMTKGYDDDGNIYYVFQYAISLDGQTTTNVTYKITNITKDSFKMDLGGIQSMTFTIYNN